MNFAKVIEKWSNLTTPGSNSPIFLQLTKETNSKLAEFILETAKLFKAQEVTKEKAMEEATSIISSVTGNAP
jgi:hypothetical protein